MSDIATFTDSGTIEIGLTHIAGLVKPGNILIPDDAISIPQAAIRAFLSNLPTESPPLPARIEEGKTIDDQPLAGDELHQKNVPAEDSQSTVAKLPPTRRNAVPGVNKAKRPGPSITRPKRLAVAMAVPMAIAATWGASALVSRGTGAEVDTAQVAASGTLAPILDTQPIGETGILTNESPVIAASIPVIEQTTDTSVDTVVTESATTDSPTPIVISTTTPMPEVVPEQLAAPPAVSSPTPEAIVIPEAELPNPFPEHIVAYYEPLIRQALDSPDINTFAGFRVGREIPMETMVNAILTLITTESVGHPYAMGINGKFGAFGMTEEDFRRTACRLAGMDPETQCEPDPNDSQFSIRYYSWSNADRVTPADLAHLTTVGTARFVELTARAYLFEYANATHTQVDVRPLASNVSQNDYDGWEPLYVAAAQTLGVSVEAARVLPLEPLRILRGTFDQWGSIQAYYAQRMIGVVTDANAGLAISPDLTALSWHDGFEEYAGVARNLLPRIAQNIDE